MELREVPMPEIGEDEVLIKVAYSGICGSELSGYLGHNALRKPPLVFGHEFAGTIAALGKRANHLANSSALGSAFSAALSPANGLAAAGLAGGLAEGQRVTANPLVTCGHCERCKRGMQQLCRSRKLLSAALPGSNAEYVKIPAAFVYGLPDTMSLQQGALAEPTACAVRAVKLAAPKPGDTILIAGMGPIGLLILQVAKLYGVGRIIAVDTNSTRLELARSLGAHACLNPLPGEQGQAPDLLADIRRIAGGAGADCAIDAVGAAATRTLCMQALAPGGKVVFTGLHEDNSVLPANLAIRNELTILGAFAYSALDFEAALQWLADGKIGLGEGVVEAPLADGATWFEQLLGSPAGVSKVLLRIGEADSL